METKKLFGWPIAFCLFVLSALVGCVGVGDSNPNAPDSTEESILEFDWAPATSSYAYLLKYTVGPATTCSMAGNVRGDIDHESGIGAYTITYHEENESSTLIYGSASRADQSGHIGPLNTAHISGPIWSQVWNFEYQSGWSKQAINGSSGYALEAAFGTDPDDAFNHLHVECDGSNATFQFLLADALVPIHSSTATGGAGLTAGPDLDEQDWLQINLGDQYAIETDGQEVVLQLKSRARPPTFGEPFVEGQISIRSPADKEVFDLESDPHASFLEQRHWNEPGSYELELDRIAYGRASLLGVLAGFVLEEEFGRTWENLERLEN